MDSKIKEAFGQIYADDQLKERTKLYIAQEMEKRQKHHLTFQWKMAYAIAICFVVCFAFVGGYHLYFTPTSIISIDVNPSIELSINRFNKVIKVQGYNEDGVNFAESLDVLHKNYHQAVDEILESDTITDCLSRDQLLSVAVVEIDDIQGEAILEYVSECTAHQENTICYGMNSDEASLAHSLGLSYGKYKVYAEIQEYDAELTPEQANQMTMRELRDLLDKLQSGNDSASSSPKETDSQRGSGNGNGSGNGSGSGNGNGNGNGSGNSSGNGNGSGNGSGNAGNNMNAGNGIGNGGNGTGSGNGMGAGNGKGSGSGNGRGKGAGNGMGNGSCG